MFIDQKQVEESEGQYAVFESNLRSPKQEVSLVKHEY